MAVPCLTFSIFILFLNTFVKCDIELRDNELVGLFPPVFTPMNDDFTLNLEVIPEYAKLMAKNSMNGVVTTLSESWPLSESVAVQKILSLSGTNGEGPATSYDERIQLIDAWYEAAKACGLQLIVQVAGLPFPDTLRLAKYAANKRVDAILALPELYYRPPTVRELVDYLCQIAKQAPNTPLFYYDIQNSNVEVNLTELLQLATAEIPSFAGIKCLLDDGLEVIKNSQLKSYQRILVRGTASLLEPRVNGSIMGAVSVFPALAWEITSTARGGDMEKARQLLDDLDKKIEAFKIHKENNAISITTAEFKAASNIVNDINVGPVRCPPIPLITDDELAEMKRRLQDAGVEVNEKK